MSIEHFRAEIWAANLLQPLRDKLVFAGPQIVNHDYEGDIQEAGDTVHVTQIGDVETFSYAKGDTFDYTDVDDAGTTLVVNQSDAFAKKLDNVDAAQAINGGAVMAAIMQNAAFTLAKDADSYVASLYTGIASGNVLPAVTDLTNSGAATPDAIGEACYDLLVDLGVALDEANAPDEGRYAVIPPWFHGCIKKAHAFINAEKYGSNTVLLNGEVGQAAGFALLKSNRTAVPSAGTNFIQAGTPMAISFASQIVKTAAISPIPGTFADGVQGLHVYGAKIFYPDGLAGVTVTRPS